MRTFKRKTHKKSSKKGKSRKQSINKVLRVLGAEYIYKVKKNKVRGGRSRKIRGGGLVEETQNIISSGKNAVDNYVNMFNGKYQNVSPYPWEQPFLYKK